MLKQFLLLPVIWMDCREVDMYNRLCVSLIKSR